MAKVNKAVENVQSWTKQMLGNEQGRKIVGEQMERIWSAEDKLIGELHDYMEGWCERRHAAAMSAADYAHKMANGADQAEISEAWSELSSNTMKRFSEDAQAQMALMQKMAAAMMPGIGGVGFPKLAAFEQSEKNADTTNSEKEAPSTK